MTVDTTAHVEHTRFRFDCLRAIAQLTDEEPPYGLAIKQHLEDEYGKPVNHGRLYPNLDQLVEAGLVEKGHIDDRTNSYALTEAGRSLLEARAQQFAAVVEDHRLAAAEPRTQPEPVETDGGAQAVEPDAEWVDSEDEPEPADRHVEDEPVLLEVDAETQAEVESLLPDGATVEDVADVVDDVRYYREVAQAFDFTTPGEAKVILARLDLGKHLTEAPSGGSA